ncbi:MAG: hypothetical protein JXR83_01635 [Deltaproteobacteria bacterium]|nr:hypothetical protein [Deltaproteobacteria bacterium]
MARSYPILGSLFPPLPAAPAPAIDLASRPLRVGPPAPAAAASSPAAVGPEAPGDLIEFMVYGTDEDGTQEVHLAFREQVLSGVYLKLRFDTAGVRAIFLVRDAAGRRIARAYGEQILARLASRGLRTAAVEIEEAVAAEGE